MAKAVAAGGDAERIGRLAAAAEQVARSITDPYQRARALTAVAEAVAAGGDAERAERIARAVTDPYQRAWALTAVAKAVAAGGDAERIGRLAATAGVAPDQPIPHHRPGDVTSPTTT